LAAISFSNQKPGGSVYILDEIDKEVEALLNPNLRKLKNEEYALNTQISKSSVVEQTPAFGTKKKVALTGDDSQASAPSAFEPLGDKANSKILNKINKSKGKPTAPAQTSLTQEKSQLVRSQMELEFNDIFPVEENVEPNIMSLPRVSQPLREEEIAQSTSFSLIPSQKLNQNKNPSVVISQQVSQPSLIAYSEIRTDKENLNEIKRKKKPKESFLNRDQEDLKNSLKKIRSKNQKIQFETQSAWRDMLSFYEINHDLFYRFAGDPEANCNLEEPFCLANAAIVRAGKFKNGKLDKIILLLRDFEMIQNCVYGQLVVGK
jgi:hypothetical protein